MCWRDNFYRHHLVADKCTLRGRGSTVWRAGRRKMKERERQRDTVQYTSIIGSPFCFFYQRNWNAIERRRRLPSLVRKTNRATRRIVSSRRREEDAEKRWKKQWKKRKMKKKENNEMGCRTLLGQCISVYKQWYIWHFPPSTNFSVSVKKKNPETIKKKENEYQREEHRQGLRYLSLLITILHVLAVYVATAHRPDR